MTSPIELLEYLNESGHNPFREWLEGLRDRQARAKFEYGLIAYAWAILAIAKALVQV